MQQRIDLSRRRFLRAAAAAGVGSAALGPFAQLNALAQSASGSDYKALVCLFMFGGNDGNNLLLPYEPADHARYATVRGNLALGRDTLRPIAPSNTGGAQFALHPSFAQLQALFGAGKAAMLPNIGPLMVPTKKTEWSARSVPLPANLFSHSDQQAAWQTDILDSTGRSGWGGRLLERLVADGSSNRGYACVSVAGGNVWSAGDRTLVPYRVSPSGNFGLSFYKPGSTDALTQAIAGMLAETRSDPFEQAWLNSVGRSVENQRILQTAINGSTLQTTFPNTDLGRQMAMIAKLISVRSALGLNRQCFFCSIGGFDTHGSDQLNTQAGRFAEIDAAVAALQAEAEAMGLGDKVTLFTASDFGRTFVSNGQGSDHGWGNHHFAVGGAVKGGRLVGTGTSSSDPAAGAACFPMHVIGGDDDVGSGNWLPKTSLDQLGRELGRWFGAGAVLGEVFPRLSYFDDNLDLMGV